MTAPLATDTVMLMKETLFLSVKGCHSIGSDRKQQLMHPASIQQVWALRTVLALHHTAQVGGAV